MPTTHFWPQPYEQLVKVLRQMGHEHDARKIAIAKQDAYLQAGKRKVVNIGPLHRAWLHFIRLTINYGYEPWRALWWMALFGALGFGVFWHANDYGAMHPAKERVFMDRCYTAPRLDLKAECPGWFVIEPFNAKDKRFAVPHDYPKFNSVVYAMDTFLPFVDLHQESYWTPGDKGYVALSFRGYLWVHILAGWFLATMFVVGITGIVKKD